MLLSRSAEQNPSWKTVQDLHSVFFHILAVEDDGKTGSLVDMHRSNTTRRIVGLRHDEPPEVPHLRQLTKVRAGRQPDLTRLSVFIHRRFVAMAVEAFYPFPHLHSSRKALTQVRPHRAQHLEAAVLCLPMALFRSDHASVLSEARTRERVRVTTMLCALSIKPSEGSRLRLWRTRSMGIQSIWSWNSLQRRELREKLGY